jgi:hypothetical protein
MTIPTRSHPYRSILTVVASAMLWSGTRELAMADTGADTNVTVMEKVIVEATKSDNRPGVLGVFGRRNIWLYVGAPDYEILSRCDAEQTLATSRHLSDSLVLDEDFIPASYLARLATPMSFIMFDQPPSKAMEALIPNSLDVTSVASYGIYHNAIGFSSGGIDVSDSDTHCAVQNRLGVAMNWAGGGVGRGPVPTGLLFKINQCIPALPAWYKFGFIGPSGILRLAAGSNGMIVPYATWVSDEKTKSLLDEAKRIGCSPDLPPIEELFQKQQVETKQSPTDWPSPDWMAHAALFLRWGMFGDSDHRKAFASFVERSRSEVVTEKLFRDCFGFGYAEMQTRLAHYFVEGGQKPVEKGYDSFEHWTRNNDLQHPPFYNLTVREATPAEVARLLGDWERMEGEAKRDSDPALSQLYFKRAGKTLNECYDEGERDSRFLAVLGLYDADIGKEAEARNILLEATKTWVHRPAAYITLARLNFDEAVRHPRTGGGEFNINETASVLGPLYAVREKAQLTAFGYRLIAETWSKCIEKPSASDLDSLGSGLKLYPFDVSLFLSVANTYAHWGYNSEAKQTIERGSKLANGRALENFVQLKRLVETCR